MFQSDFSNLYGSVSIEPTITYSFTTWKQERANMNIPELSLFFIGTTCDQVGSMLSRCARRRLDTSSLLHHKRAPYGHDLPRATRKFDKERGVYARSVSGLLEYHWRGWLVRFWSSPFQNFKEWYKRPINEIWAHWCADHRMFKHCQSLFTLAEESPTGANRILEVSHSFINSRITRGKFPKKLYAQMDNYLWENKKGSVFVYLDCRISCPFFYKIHALFLAFEHTHEDIDQCFSCTSRRLKAHKVPTLPELHRLTHTAYNELTTVTAMTSVANFSGHIESQSCSSRNSPPFFHYCYIRYTRQENGAPLCDVKHGIDEDCAMLHQQKCSFISSIRSFSARPNWVISCPDGKIDVMRRIHSEKPKISNRKSIPYMMQLVNQVF